MHSLPWVLTLVFLIIALFFIIKLIIERWVIYARGFGQLGLFVVSEAIFVCNKGAPCQNCPLSFGVCPIGTVQRIAFISQFPFYAVIASIGIIGLLFGTLTCGWACPVGFIQDILNSLKIKNIRISNSFKSLRIIVFILLTMLIFLELSNHSLSRLGIGLFSEFVVIGGGLFLLISIFIKRPFCRFLCPLGFVFGKLNKISPIKVILNRKHCVSCGKCNNVCIVDIKPSAEVNGDLCMKCFNCKKVCESKRA